MRTNTKNSLIGSRAPIPPDWHMSGSLLLLKHVKKIYKYVLLINVINTLSYSVALANYGFMRI